MISNDQLDSYAAVFTVLARLQLQPADADTRARVMSLLEQWPLRESLGEGANESADYAAGESSSDAAGKGLTERGIALLKESAAKAESDSAVWQDQNALYGIAASAKVSPFESVHLGEDHLVFDERTLDVRRAYAQVGLQAPRLGREPDDHIGLEMDFLARCCLEVLDALEVPDTRRAEAIMASAEQFTREHLAQWAPQMLTSAMEEANSAWVKGMQMLSLGALEKWAADIGVPWALPMSDDDE